MEQIRLYNSRTRDLEVLKPVSGNNLVTIYNCGPTVYKRQHIGNMRRFLNADFLRRTLLLLGYAVHDVTNITDVGHLTQDEIDEGEDKLEKEAKALKKTPQDIAQEQINLFFQDIDALHIQHTDEYPRASAHISEMIALIEKLIQNNHAYITKSGVYFDISTFPDYGKLSGNGMNQIHAGHRIAVREEKRNPADFALWMINDTHLQLWDSPWGKGYPGWHIECSAMSMKYLGETIDIHTGGEDNRFPHHENEIAQSEGATGKEFVKIWMHNRHLLLSGKKMAKREGESITLDTLKDKDYSPLAFRLLVFAHHYRSPIDFSWELLDEFQGHVESLQKLVARSPLITSSPPLLLRKEKGANPSFPLLTKEGLGEVSSEFISALQDDLNTSLAFSIFLETIKELNKALDANDTELVKRLSSELVAMDSVIGVLEHLQKELGNQEIPDSIQALVEDREEAKKSKDFSRADSLRQEIIQLGYTVQDTPEGPRITKVL
ncbi:MAG TPA: cysteine--tRNA ligase [Candidatus Andersenbacteria bacterium]|nr:cysteine--tRNA ligase [Candidatus Andersenbacteria bacterium]